MNGRVCPSCDINWDEYEAKNEVVEAAELLVDAAEPDLYSEDAVICAAAVLKQRISHYREVLDKLKQEGGTDVFRPHDSN